MGSLVGGEVGETALHRRARRSPSRSSRARPRGRYRVQPGRSRSPPPQQPMAGVGILAAAVSLFSSGGFRDAGAAGEPRQASDPRETAWEQGLELARDAVFRWGLWGPSTAVAESRRWLRARVRSRPVANDFCLETFASTDSTSVCGGHLLAVPADVQQVPRPPGSVLPPPPPPPPPQVPACTSTFLPRIRITRSIPKSGHPPRKRLDPHRTPGTLYLHPRRKRKLKTGALPMRRQAGWWAGGWAGTGDNPSVGKDQARSRALSKPELELRAFRSAADFGPLSARPRCCSSLRRASRAGGRRPLRSGGRRRLGSWARPCRSQRRHRGGGVGGYPGPGLSDPTALDTGQCPKVRSQPDACAFPCGSPPVARPRILAVAPPRS